MSTSLQSHSSPISVSGKPQLGTISLEQPSFATHSLKEKLFGDVAIGAGVTFAISPILTIIDKAIVQSAAGTHTLARSTIESLQMMVTNPIKTVRSPAFLLVWGVYAGTYTTANCLKTMVEHKSYTDELRNNGKKSSSAELGKVGIFLGTTFVNSGMAMLKDKAYAQIYGSNPVKSAIPRWSYAMWIARDLSVIGSSFILPDIVYPKLVDAYGLDEKTARSVCQLALPVSAQFVASPLHYIGLDLYNRQLASASWRESIIDRSKSLYRGALPVTIARIARIAPGYGFAGVFNTKLRDDWREYLLEREVAMMMESPREENGSRLVALVH